MSNEEKLYLELGAGLTGAVESQLFGKPCFKVKGKAFICFFKECLVCKLPGQTHKEVLTLDGTELFDPSGKKRPMKEWVQVPFSYARQWEKYARSAFDYVN